MFSSAVWRLLCKSGLLSCIVQSRHSVLFLIVGVNKFVTVIVLDVMKIFAVDTQFKQLRKRSLKKVQASAGFEPVTSAIPVQCSTN